MVRQGPDILVARDLACYHELATAVTRIESKVFELITACFSVLSVCRQNIGNVPDAALLSRRSQQGVEMAHYWRGESIIKPINICYAYWRQFQELNDYLMQ